MEDLMTLRPLALSLLARVQSGVSHAELVHVPHPLWPLSNPTVTHELPKRPLRISILDASFNPPTLAHLALISSDIPSKNDADEEYDARLLLLSVKNADKTLKSTDATYIQRLEMMRLLAGHVRPSSSLTNEKANVAVGIINEPTFVGKSKTLLSFFRQRFASFPTTASPHPQLELTFIVGMDTLERLVAPRYYSSEDAMMTSLRRFLSPQEENCVVVCARRNLDRSSSDEAEDVLGPAQEFISSGRIKLMDIGAEESTLSSTAARNTAKQLGLGEEGRKALGRHTVPSIINYIVREGLYVE